MGSLGRYLRGLGETPEEAKRSLFAAARAIDTGRKPAKSTQAKAEKKAKSAPPKLTRAQAQEAAVRSGRKKAKGTGNFCLTVRNKPGKGQSNTTCFGAFKAASEAISRNSDAKSLILYRRGAAAR
jgi:hypothetical protein